MLKRVFRSPDRLVAKKTARRDLVEELRRKTCNGPDKNHFIQQERILSKDQDTPSSGNKYFAAISDHTQYIFPTMGHV